MDSPVDVLIIVLFDSGVYRNGDAEHMHMVPTWDHRNPSDFRTKGRSEVLEHYETVKIVKGHLSTAHKISDSLFEVADDSGKTWQGRKIILATGSQDIFPDIPGYAEAWVKRIYHCLYCEGYEDRGAASSGVLAIQAASVAPMAIHLAENAAHLSSTVTIYTHGSKDLSAQIQESLGTAGTDQHTFHVDPRPISRLQVLERGGIQLTFADGTTAVEAFLVHNPFTKTNGQLAEQLGVEMTASGELVANFPAYQTSVRGVFAAGECATQYKVVAGAISSGCNAAVAASTQLLAEKYGHHSLV
ncbi:FAD/NAD(P)-binding domain-containing protein [Aspergillus venezuelensis]